MTSFTQITHMGLAGDGLVPAAVTTVEPDAIPAIAFAAAEDALGPLREAILRLPSGRECALVARPGMPGLQILLAVDDPFADGLAELAQTLDIDPVSFTEATAAE